MSSILRKMFETVPSLETGGVLIEYAPGVAFKVARAGGANKKFARVMNKLAKPHRRAIQAEIMDDNLSLDLTIQAYAKTIIVGWEGITKDLITKKDEDAEVALECTEENIIEVMKAQPNIFEDIVKMSQDLALYRAETLENDSKNS